MCFSQPGEASLISLTQAPQNERPPCTGAQRPPAGRSSEQLRVCYRKLLPWQLVSLLERKRLVTPKEKSLFSVMNISRFPPDLPPPRISNFHFLAAL